jgi:hypothetical protein
MAGGRLFSGIFYCELIVLRSKFYDENDSMIETGMITYRGVGVWRVECLPWGRSAYLGCWKLGELGLAYIDMRIKFPGQS